MTECPGCGYNCDCKTTPIKSIFLYYSAPSLNQVGSNSRGPSGNKYRNIRKKYEKMLVHYDLPKAEKKRRVWFVRHWARGKYAYDYQNLVGGFKPLLDVIVRNGWLVDDSPRWVEDYYRQQRSNSGCDKIEIIFEEID